MCRKDPTCHPLSLIHLSWHSFVQVSGTKLLRNKVHWLLQSERLSKVIWSTFPASVVWGLGAHHPRTCFCGLPIILSEGQLWLKRNLGPFLDYLGELGLGILPIRDDYQR